jgi:hypothetical protein
MLVLWGARAGDVQAGSREDLRRQEDLARLFKSYAQMARNMKRVLAALPSADDVAEGLRRLGRTGIPASEVLANVRANLERMDGAPRE